MSSFSGKTIRHTATAFAIALVVAALGVRAQNDALVGVNYDDGIYALLSRAVAQGDGYGLKHLDNLPGVKYPPAYPLSLVPFWWLADTRDAALSAMKIANGVILGLAAGIFMVMILDLGLLSLPLAAGLTLLAFASGSMMLVSSSLLSEPLYMLVLFLALWRADAIRQRLGFGGFVSLGVLAALVALTRTAGLAAVAAIVIGLGTRYGRRGAIVSGATSVFCLLPWALFVLWGARHVPEPLVPRYGSYTQLYLTGVAGSLETAFLVVSVNLGAILQTLGSLLVPHANPLAASILGVVFLAFAFIGTRRTFAQAPATALYPWFYLLLVCVWTWPPSRFVFILFPLLLALAAVAYGNAIQRIMRTVADTDNQRSAHRLTRVSVVALVTIAGLIAVNMAYRQSRALAARVWDGAELARSAVSEELIDWIDVNVPEAAVVAYEFDPLIVLHTGRTAVPNNYDPRHEWYASAQKDTEPIARLLDEMNVEYLLASRALTPIVEPLDRLMGRYPGALKLVHVTPLGGLIFEVEQENLTPIEGSGRSGER